MSTPSLFFNLTGSSNPGGANAHTPPTSMTGSPLGTNPYITSLNSLLSSLANPTLPQAQGHSLPQWFAPQGTQSEGMSSGAPMSGLGQGFDQTQMLMALLQQILPMLGMGQ